MVAGQLKNLQNTQSGPRNVMASSRPVVSVEEVPTGYTVNLSLRNPATGRIVTKRFTVKFADVKKDKLKLTASVIQGIVQHLLKSVPLSEIQERYDAKGIASLVSHFVGKISRRKIYEELRRKFAEDGSAPRIYPSAAALRGKPVSNKPRSKNKKAKNGNEEESENDEGDDDDIEPERSRDSGKIFSQLAADGDEFEEESGGPRKNSAQISFETALEKTRAQLTQLAEPLPTQKSIFIPEHTGVTYGIIGKSFSGKTHFWVHELNKLTSEELKQYNAIFFFTESTSAEPLASLSARVKKKMITFDRFCPSLLAVLKRINDETRNNFKFLVVLDDILELRSMLIIKMILTLRNSNISTVISIQYEKLLTPSQRSSLHNLFLFNLRTESWEYMLRGYLLGNFKELIPALSERENIGRGTRRLTPSMIAEILRSCMNDYICFYDQRRDVLKIYYKRTTSKSKKRSLPEGDSESEDETVVAENRKNQNGSKAKRGRSIPPAAVG
jgi:hypothetical protein